ncbi:MAG: phosphate ABC transporter permease PstA [Nitrososphaerales archaeon]
MQSQEEVQQPLMPWQDKRVLSNYRRRRVKEIVIKYLAIACVIFVLLPLLDMLYLFAFKGLQLATIQRLTELTSSGTGLGGGGIANAIVGSFALIGLSSLFAVPIGLFAGVYLAEFTQEHNRYAEMIRFIADILAGVPSIVLGYVGFLLFVLYFGWGLSPVAGALTLSILMFPYILRTTEISIRRVPESIREGALALGSTKTSMINRLTLRFALPGVITGILLAISISISETAPLLYTAGFSNYMPSALLHSQIGYLTFIVWTYSQFPSDAAHDLAYLASFMLLSFVVVINLVARLGLRRFSKI